MTPVNRLFERRDMHDRLIREGYARLDFEYCRAMLAIYGTLPPRLADTWHRARFVLRGGTKT